MVLLIIPQLCLFFCKLTGEFSNNDDRFRSNGAYNLNDGYLWFKASDVGVRDSLRYGCETDRDAGDKITQQIAGTVLRDPLGAR